MQKLFTDYFILKMYFHLEGIEALVVRLLMQGYLSFKLVDHFIFFDNNEFYLQKQFSLFL